MRKNLLYLAIMVMGGLSLTACSEDELNSQSIITVTQTEPTQFDKWLEANYVDPYNIRFVYRYEEIESDLNYFTVPANTDDAIIMAHLLKYLCIEAYDEVAGINFTRNQFPKMFFLIGEWEYRNNGTYILGTAEGGKKIMLSGINYVTPIVSGQYSSWGSFRFNNGTDISANLNYYYLKTVHHEFTHILNQTKDFSEDYQQITGSTYLADDWSSDEGETGYLQRGYISAYSQMEPREDFAEVLSMYVTNSAEQWSAWMKEAGSTGSALIGEKLASVRDYMQTVWNIDIDVLRASVLRRQNEVVSGRIDLTDITVK